MRPTVVDALYSNYGFWYVVVSPASTSSTYVITVDTTTGNPLYTGVPFVDVFPDHSIATKNLTELGAQPKIHGEGLVGFAVTENASTIAIIDKTEVTAEFPPNHKIRTIRHVSYIQIPTNKSAPKNSVFDDFQLIDNHFVCDTYDLTKLFPVDGIDNPDLGFVWNNGWRRPFDILGIPQVCVYLIQGVCVSKHFENFGFTLSYVARRSVLNPGTRYAARGLNDLNSPGNEVECELLFFKDDKFWSERWRRGSIPIRWKTILSSKLGSPKHTVDEDYFKGTVDYFKDITERYGEKTMIRCISLLQTESDHAENEIKEFFTKALDQLYDFGIKNVFFSPFDLNQHLHADGSGEAMMDFLSYIAPLGDGDGFTKGTLPLSVEQNQKGLMRFNCADSLDRTNLATFYYAMKFTAEWCKEINTGLTANYKDADSNHPNLIVEQDIIDFLAAAFVESGNVISRLYTNTPAIKVNAIKKFSPSIVVTQSDTNITMQRRLQNVMNDPARQRLIEMWTQPPNLSWYHRIDPQHIYIVPAADGSSAPIPRAIFSSVVQQLEIDVKESTVCLPTPMIIFSFMILMYPSNQKLKGITLRGGMSLQTMEPIMHIMLPAVEQMTWLRYRPSNTVRWGLEKMSDKYIRFLSFTFESEANKFSIGNIKIEGKSIFSGSRPKIPKQLPQPDESSKQQFIETFNDLLKGGMNLNEALELEKIRITLNIKEDVRNQLALQKGISPWVVDSRSQLSALPNPSICAFCRQPPVGEKASFRFYCQAHFLPGLIAKSDDSSNNSINYNNFSSSTSPNSNNNNNNNNNSGNNGNGNSTTDDNIDVSGNSNNNNDNNINNNGNNVANIKKFKGFPICPKCNDQAEMIVQITSVYEDEFKPKFLPLPHFQKGSASHELNERNQAYTNEATAAFLNTDSSLLWATEGSEKFAKGETKTFDMFIVQQGIILKIVVDSKSDGFVVTDENGNILESTRLNEDQIEFQFKEQPITQRLKFSITATKSAESTKSTETAESKESTETTELTETTESTELAESKELAESTESPNAANDDTVEITKIKAYYIITEFPIEETKVCQPETLKAGSPAEIQPQFDQATRTETYSLKRSKKVKSMLIEMVVGKGSSSPLSFYLALYKKNKLVSSEHFILPEAKNGSKLWYNIGKGGVEADTIKVFYSDRIATLKPHNIKFVF